jgi:hypothetical protein
MRRTGRGSPHILFEEQSLAAYEDERYPALRKMLPYTSALLVIAAIYVGYIVFQRWQERREAARQESQQVVDSSRKTYEAYGSGALKILNFTISPGMIRSGETAMLCYGVSNAKSVTVSPKPNNSVWPSLARCVEITPKKTTAYTLNADDGNGHSETKSLTINVQ